MWRKAIVIGLCVVGLAAAEITSAETEYRSVAKGDAIVAEQGAVTPVSMAIPSVSVEVKILPGGKTGGGWILAEREANYWQMGRSFLVYGHNTDEVLGNLGKAELGDVVKIVWSDGSGNNYRVVEKKLVRGKSEINTPRGDSRQIVLVTCGGWLDWERWVVVASEV
ncbi:hypothetical protein A2899_00960 [Candidatus Amesbacteria bacterium RIFCSPLOWO2_01_FULL_49_25]|uniref:Sortase n=1 Tax=Candidatus Amesbacteria bacterium RIFCSPHIGHO2_01_FULL_48_32b TaxID=1797253 RepID=A0A1F4YFP2_9BACT|nr:MAG: hypothetical protein A2876_00110 [Candidatus Amesbacteria bacterium RIFCSPHIGHO2_01_FULL_48_32b]OGD07136.1 MAG: hypothetical protein A2899_00960 [Candidatus Amesbacteria bacterium RIFCSPLOWO2_01_FULL_49_25]